MSMPPLGKNFFGRSISHADSCICQECREADQRKNLIASLAAKDAENTALRAALAERQAVVDELVATEDEFARLLIYAPDMRKKAWKAYQARVRAVRASARALATKEPQP